KNEYRLMKTSNKFLLAAAVFTLLSLVVYDLFLRAEFKSGNYTDPYQDYVTLNFKDFDILDLPSSTAANAKIVQGPFSIRIDKYAADFVQVNQEGKRLQIKAGFEGNYQSTSSQYILLISCPKLSDVNANAGYRANNMKVTDTIVREDWNMRKVLIAGFKQDSLHISQDYGSTIVLENNHIRAISAVIGKSRGSGSNLIIEDNNEFGNAGLDILNDSKLFLENAKIQNLSYQLGDKSKLIITGKAKNLLNNIKPGQK
ncbi:MAG TPA: hypothetical protein VGZ71_06020, partial [Puia sp.]|nr:hypothetical protein [Puia sp.]